MKIEQIRVYAEVLEQGIDFKEYIENSGIKCSVINIYSHKARGEISETDSIVTRIRKSKDVDVLITAITFCSVELYKKLKFDLLAVSYPGAQGDRCVLTGSGRNVLRTYIDIIACGTDDNGVTVYLEECKANIADSQNDAEKLNEFITNPEKMKGLEKLYHKVTNGKEKFDISIGIGAKISPAARALDVDYIFMFDIDDTAIDKTVVRYNIAIIDTALINKFSPLINENGKLAGELSYPEIYVIQ